MTITGRNEKNMPDFNQLNETSCFRLNPTGKFSNVQYSVLLNNDYTNKFNSAQYSVCKPCKKLKINSNPLDQSPHQLKTQSYANDILIENVQRIYKTKVSEQKGTKVFESAIQYYLIVI